LRQSFQYTPNRNTMSLICMRSRVVRVSVARHTRSLATPATSGPSASQKTTFTATLTEGPSLDDFISGDVPERVVLGNKNTYVVSLARVKQPAYLHTRRRPRLPSYLKTSIPTGASFNSIRKDLRGLGLHTVCEEARCPNIGDCWGGKDGATPEENKRAATATIMVGLLLALSSQWSNFQPAYGRYVYTRLPFLFCQDVEESTTPRST